MLNPTLVGSQSSFALLRSVRHGGWRLGRVLLHPGMGQDPLDREPVERVVFQQLAFQVSAAGADIGRVREIHQQERERIQSFIPGI